MVPARGMQAEAHQASCRSHTPLEDRGSPIQTGESHGSHWRLQSGSQRPIERGDVFNYNCQMLKGLVDVSGTYLDRSCEDMAVVRKSRGKGRSVVEDILRLSLLPPVLLMEGVEVLP